MGVVITLPVALGDGCVRTERVISFGDFFRVRLVIELLYDKRGSIHINVNIMHIFRIPKEEVM